MARMRITFLPTYEDYFIVSKAATFNTPTLVLMGLMGLATLITFIGLIFGFITVDPGRMLLFVLPPGMFIVFLVAAPINLRYRARKMASDQTRFSWILTSTGITIEKNGQKEKLTWDTFGLVQELEQHFILFYQANRSKYIFLPKRALDGEEQQQDFRSLLKSKIKKWI